MTKERIEVFIRVISKSMYKVRYDKRIEEQKRINELQRKYKELTGEFYIIPVDEKKEVNKLPIKSRQKNKQKQVKQKNPKTNTLFD